MQSKVRITNLDAACGLLIIHMIIYHAFLWVNNTNNNFYIISNQLLFFFMPWFFYKSGSFYVKKSFSENYRNLIRKFIYPFITYSIIGEIVHCYEMYFIFNDTNLNHYFLSPIKTLLLHGSFEGNPALWFLISLFLVKFLFGIFDKNSYSLSILFAIALLTAIFGSFFKNKFTVPDIFLNVSAGIVFFFIGYKLKLIQYNKKLIFVVSIVYISLVIGYPSTIDFRTWMTTKGSSIVYIISSIAGIIIINNLFRIKWMKIPVLTYIGEHSLSFYCIHWILFRIIYILFGLYDNTCSIHIKFCYLIIGSMIILSILSYWIDLLKEKMPNIGKFL